MAGETKKKAAKRADSLLTVAYTKKLNIRKEPKITAEIIAIVSEGDKLKELSSKSTKDWACVEIAKGVVGYASKSYLK